MTRHLEAHLARELNRASELSLQDYDVLSSIAALPEHRWCAKELMLHLQWSYSRLSHHVSRMEQRSLITRATCTHGTGIDIVATNDGMKAIREATADHLEAVRTAFLDRLESGDLERIDALSHRVLEHLPGPTPSKGW